MNSIEYWVLRIADSDWTWIGFNWMRPRKQTRIGPCYIVLSSILLGLPGFALGVGMLYWLFGRVTFASWVLLGLAAFVFELMLHLIFAHFWNRRAAKLVLSQT